MPTSLTQMTSAIRVLAMDAVQKANSGHPGMPMGMAEIALATWHRHMRHNPKNPQWLNRDRFILSNGHGSMLLYALLHLTGYDLSMEDIKNFRTLHSKTPGHPEYGYTPGVETTTGPLGQGITNAVGFALAEQLLAQTFNRDGLPIVDHYTYVFLGDGCLMEGVSHEACSLAGTWKLGKLIALYDDNGISIDGKVHGWFTDNTVQRFESYGWHVQTVDGHDVDAIDAAIRVAKAATDKPSLICCKTVIGKGAPNKQGSHKTHGEALGTDEIAATRAALGWAHAPFEMPQEIYDAWNAHAAGATAEQQWNELFATYQAQYPDLAAEFTRRMRGDLPANFDLTLRELIEGAREKAETVATRKASGNALAKLGPQLPELVGGSADLMGSVFTNWPGSEVVQPGKAGNIVNFGVREFAMAAITNGMVLHGGFIPETGTFLVFSDYSRNALRMAALMKIRNIFVFTHDSIGVGEDGPTHQPIEHVSSLRLIPNMHVWRPCDTVETAVAWGNMLKRKDGPACLVATRQNCAFQQRSDQAVADIARGGYVLADTREIPFKAIIMATGSEVDLAMRARAALATQGIPVRVVSMPCTQVFDAQDKAYRESVLPVGIPRVAIEAGVTDYWHKYVGLDGAVIGLDRYGESAPFKDLYEHFGFTVANVVAAVQNTLK